MVDRTPDYLSHLESQLQRVGNREAALQLRQQQLLRPVKPETPFAKAARDVAGHIRQLRVFVSTHKRDYLSAARSTVADKDHMEAEVGMFVSGASKQLEVLKNSVVAAQQQQQGQVLGTLSGQAIAHLHAVVLILAEQLQSTARGFDDLRARRYRQMMTQRIAPIKPMPSPPASGAMPGANGTVQTAHAGGQQGDGWDFDEKSFSRGREGTEAGGSGRQQQLLVQRENEFLLAELEGLGDQVTRVSRTVQDIATLNTMFSTAVLHQVEQIEMLYNMALEASLNITKGNQQLRSTLRHGASFRYYFSVLMMVLTLLLLFFHWFNS